MMCVLDFALWQEALLCDLRGFGVVVHVLYNVFAVHDLHHVDTTVLL